MQQRGSKYDQKIKDEALALIASGVKISNASVPVSYTHLDVYKRQSYG